MERIQGTGGDTGTEKEATLKTPQHLWEELNRGAHLCPRSGPAGLNV